MKTKNLPALVMLLAGAVYCIIGIRDGVELLDFTIQLLIVLVIFYILGGIAKMVLDKFMGEVENENEEEKSEETTEESEEETADEEETEETEITEGAE